MGMITFSHMMNRANIYDSNVTSSTIDIYFTATNFEEDDQEGNDDSSLIRFEFFEILVRIARGKYVDTGKIPDLPTATEKLI